ncbi:MAG: ribulokinase [Saprospiraceae bacterium]|nr:ribulokinase [Saprospiraceae bacterium]
MNKYVFGVDFGTDSVRSLLVNALNGEEIATSVFYYPRWKNQLFCHPVLNQFRQHPLDYLEGLTYTIKACLQGLSEEIIQNIKGISIDTTGSTPVAVDESCTPLSLLPEFADNPNAMFILWKDHTSIEEAEAINKYNQQSNIDYLQYVGGIYSSEWFWAKLLHILKTDEKIRSNIASFVEHCDWIPFVLTGGKSLKELKRGICAAGHKALWSESFDGYPPNDYFAAIDPLLDGFTEKLHQNIYSTDSIAGKIAPEWSEKLGLPLDVTIGIGAFDAHVGAVGGQIEPFYLSKVMGTSTCDMMVVSAKNLNNKCVKGICGQVKGSILPGLYGLEAGQSAFGDVYAWFKNLLLMPAIKIIEESAMLSEDQKKELIHSLDSNLLHKLSQQADELPLEISSTLAVDWLNGRRTPDAEQRLEGAMSHLNLGTEAHHVFRALVEATCFGSKAIVERFIMEGIPVNGIIGLGGVAKKSPFIMQMLADILNMPVKVHKSEQTCALGAAMFAATAAGIYSQVEQAMQAMGAGFEKTYYPNQEKVDLYQRRYQKYLSLGNYLENNLM